MIYNVFKNNDFIACADCLNNEIELTIVRKYVSYPTEESFDLFRGEATTGTLLLHAVGVTPLTSVTYTACTTEGLHTLHLMDASGDGWGISTFPAKLTVYAGSVELWTGSLAPTYQNDHFESFETFNILFNIPYGSSWKYTDFAQSSSAWTLPSYVDSSWSTQASGSFPVFTGIVRYYRQSFTAIGSSLFVDLSLFVNIDAGFVVYIGGSEIYRHKLPSGTITSTTTATAAADSSVITRNIAIPKNYLVSSSSTTGSSIVICIEVHQYEGQTASTDPFDLASIVLFKDENTCTSDKFVGGTYTGFPAGTSANSVANVFDDIFTNNYYATSSTPYFIYTLPNNNVEWINEYGIASAGGSSNGDPQSWELYASNDQGNTWVLLDTQDNIVFSKRATLQRYSLRSNRVAYNQFKLQILSGTKADKMGLSGFQVFTCNYDVLPVGINYDTTSVTGYAAVDAISLTPLSSGYRNYTVNPQFPEGLTLNSQSGAISGVPLSVMTGPYVISGIDATSGVSYSFTINFSITDCSFPDHVKLFIYRVSNNYADEELFTIKSSTGVSIYTGSASNYATTSTIICVPIDYYTLVLTDNGNDGWTFGSAISISLLYTNTDKTRLGVWSLPSEGEKIFHFDTRFALTTEATTWGYHQGSIPIDWYKSASVTSPFTSYSPSSTITSTSTIWLFRTTFVINNLNNYVGLELFYKARGGVVIYINGEEYTRDRLPKGTLSTNTIPTESFTTSTYRSMTIPLTHISIDTNTIAIGIFHSSTATPSTLDFNACIRFVTTMGSLGRLWNTELSSDPVSPSINYLTDIYSDTDWGYTSPSAVTIDIIMDFTEIRREYVNKYCLTSSANNAKDQDPSEWELFASQDGINFISVSNATNIEFSDRNQQRCFYLTSLTEPYRVWKLHLLNIYNPSYITFGYFLSDLMFDMVDNSQLIPPPLVYTPNEINAFISLNFPSLSHSSSLYNNFHITPDLPYPLSLDASTGLIKGIPIASLPTTTYNITAQSPQGDISSTLLVITITPCQHPNIMFSLYIYTGWEDSNIRLKLTDSDNTVLLNTNSFQSMMEVWYPFCQPNGIYTVTISDSYNDGWDDAYFEVLLEDNTRILQGSIGGTEGERSFPIELNYILNPKLTLWTYHISTSDVDVAWNTITYVPTDWKESIPGGFDKPDSITQYYRSLFTMQNKELYGSAVISIRTRYGVIAYINGVEIYRDNVPGGYLASNIYCFEEREETISLGTALGVAFSSIVNGNNVLAFEIHTSNSTTIYTDFDASLMLTSANSYRVLDGRAYTNDEANEDYVYSMFDNIKGTIFTSMNTKCAGEYVGYYYLYNRKEYINSYTIITGNRCNRKNPTGWMLEGSNDNDNWSVLHHVTDYEVTTYSKESTFDFYNERVFSNYRLVITQCNNLVIGSSVSPNEMFCGDEYEEQGYQFAELMLFSKKVYYSCAPTADGFGGAMEGAYAYKDCPSYYQGRIEALCTNGKLGTKNTFCTLMKPTIINYTHENSTLLFYIGQDTSYIPAINGAELTCISTPSLPEGLVLDKSTGSISGDPTNEFTNTLVTISCSNTQGSISTVISLSSVHTPGLALWIWIVIALVIVIIIVVVIVIIVKNIHSSSSSSSDNSTKKKAHNTLTKEDDNNKNNSDYVSMSGPNKNNKNNQEKEEIKGNGSTIVDIPSQ
ncbi:hypothetical protein WA158_001945 [Blastocystis sp. Blastoise]